MSDVAHVMRAPMFDGQAFSYANNEEKVMLWNQMSTLDPQKRAANLLLHMSNAARKVRVTVGGDVIGDTGGVARILLISREEFAPDAYDCIFQDMVQFLYFKRAGQNMDTYPEEFDMLRKKAAARMLMGSGLPGGFVPSAGMRNAALTKNEKTLVLASLQDTLAFPEVSAQMRRVFGPRGYGSRQDVLESAEMGTVSEEEDF